MPAQLRIMLGDELPVDGGIAPAADCYGAFDLTDIVALLVGTLELLFLVVIVRVDDCHGSGLGTLVDRARLILLVELLLEHASEHFGDGFIICIHLINVKRLDFDQNKVLNPIT